MSTFYGLFSRSLDSICHKKFISAKFISSVFNNTEVILTHALIRFEFLTA